MFIKKSTSSIYVLLPTSKKEVFRVVQESKSKYSEDYMDLNYIFIKSVAATIAHFLSKLINACFQESIFSDSLKIASVIPLHKESEKTEPNNFRPISLLPTLVKILEKNILNRISNYFEEFEILNSKQFGFREKRGTVDAVSTLVDLIRSSKHSYTEHTYCTFLDLRKAFYTIDRKILLQKCKMYGLGGSVYTILESYLKNRKQFVQSGQRKSQMTEDKKRGTTRVYITPTSFHCLHRWFENQQPVLKFHFLCWWYCSLHKVK